MLDYGWVPPDENMDSPTLLENFGLDNEDYNELFDDQDQDECETENGPDNTENSVDNTENGANNTENGADNTENDADNIDN
ncbi:34289_t:CDS:2, partial [Gigaspora margarita]